MLLLSSTVCCVTLLENNLAFISHDRRKKYQLLDYIYFLQLVAARMRDVSQAKIFSLGLTKLES